MRRNHVDPVAALLVGHRKRLPGFRARVFGYFRPRSSLRRVGIVRRAPPSCSFAVFRCAPPAASSANHVAHVEDRSIIRVHRQPFAVAVRDGARHVDKLRAQYAARGFQFLRRRNRNAGSESQRNRKVRRIHHADQQTAAAHEALKVRDAAPSEARPHIVGLIGLAKVWSLRRDLPRQRVSPHRHAFDDSDRVAPADRREQDHIVLRPQVAVFGDVLGADVVERHLQLVQRQSPPSLVLRAQPRVHHRHARCFDCMSLHRRRGLDRENLQTKL